MSKVAVSSDCQRKACDISNPSPNNLKEQSELICINHVALTGVDGLDGSVDDDGQGVFVAHGHDHDVNTRLGDVVAGQAALQMKQAERKYRVNKEVASIVRFKYASDRC